MEMNTNVTDNKILAKNLFHSAMKGEWNHVVEIYRQDLAAHKATITRSGDTALHVAVSDIQEDIVEELLSIIKQNNTEEALEVKNERGDTALHIAASLGSVRICSCIAQVNCSLVGAHNNENETPLFIAALHGKKDAFLCLNSYVDTERRYSYSRRKDGQTILHCAISGDYFDLAFQIIYLYEALVGSVDEHGLSPLHILASKTTAFRSGSHLGRGNGIIYHCIFVDDLKIDLSFHPPANISKEMQSMNYPDNYATCIHFLKLLKKLVQPAFRSSSLQKDAENPEATNYKPQGSSSLQKEAKNRRGPNKRAQGHQLLPPNYHTCFNFAKLVSKATLIVFGLGSRRIKKLEEKKKKHRWSVQIMNELVERASLYEYEDNGSNPQPPSDDHETKPYAVVNGGDVTFVKEAFQENDHPPQSKVTPENDRNQEQNEKKGSESKLKEENAKKEGVSVIKRETPILIAAKCGITEMVEKILEVFPMAIHDMNSEKKNIVLLAVESRQPHVYQLLLKRQILRDSIFRAVDENGNSALHLAAMLGDHKPWLIPGAALQMQWEIKWYEFVKNSMPFHFFVRYNKQGKTPRDVFSDTHDDLVMKGGEWLTNTSESCSVVAALIATVAFATSTAVPGGVKDSGKPTLEFEPAFDVFAISSLIALCFSVTAVVMFLAILTSRYQERDFGIDLPRKLLFGLTSLFVSIASMLVSFCAGHFLVLKDKLKYAAYPVYAVTCLPVTLFAVAQFPLYFDLAWATFKKVPQRSYRAVPL
ncbi:hypothetical protein SLA2020_107510 [Shorea laevis]